MASFRRADDCFLIVNISKVASIDSLSKTCPYGVTHIPTSVLIKKRKVFFTFNGKMYLKESSRINQSYSAWRVVTKTKSEVIPVELGGMSYTEVTVTSTL